MPGNDCYGLANRVLMYFDFNLNFKSYRIFYYSNVSRKNQITIHKAENKAVVSLQLQKITWKLRSFLPLNRKSLTIVLQSNLVANFL